jgi:HAD superfamily phosphatase
MKPVLVFDVDGVLAEVSESYREAIVQTVRHFTGKTVGRDVIQDYKNQGGYNNDWLLSQRLCADCGVGVPYQDVVEHFCRIFFGENNNGLIAREQWIPHDGLLARLASRYQLAVFTGRNRTELDVTLRRFGAEGVFDPIVTSDDVRDGKPAPEGLLLIGIRTGAEEMFYVGDTVDDARCAADAGVPFIGVAAPESPRRGVLVHGLRRNGAIVVLEDVNQIEGALPV